MRAFAIAALFVLASTAAQAETVSFHGMLSGKEEVPANASGGTGMVMGTYDTVSKKFTYEATYSGLSGPATAAHFHGPADRGANARPVVPVASAASPIKGEATLTDVQAADLLAGKWYLNVHTAANPGGEIRGQVLKQ